MKKLAIIGASYLQEPLIEKARSLGYQTHVFAWKTGDIGERTADFFYPLSIVEKEKILERCREIGIDGICTIASDLAVVTVNYVAEKMGLPGNSMESTELSTNKHLMRKAFDLNGDPSPRSILVSSISDLEGIKLCYPVIVKPTDRSGSRGITELFSEQGLESAIEEAKAESFEKKALVEEFVTGQEYSVEFLSFRGNHHFLTEKRVIQIVTHALDSLKIQNGASHSELKINADGVIRLIEIGGRMGGDFIGSSLVNISTGIDFIEQVIRIALGEEPILVPSRKKEAAAVRFIFSQKDIAVFDRLRNEHPEFLLSYEIHPVTSEAVTDSASRFGYFLFKAEDREALLPYLPQPLCSAHL